VIVYGFRGNSASHNFRGPLRDVYMTWVYGPMGATLTLGWRKPFVTVLPSEASYLGVG
jgi:hypothetical protein